jgi:hypothetical protein
VDGRDKPGQDGSTGRLKHLARGIDFKQMEAALKRASYKAIHGTREERSGRYQSVRSSAIISFRYDNEERELDITFTSGRTYRYFGVPLEIYVDLLDAESKGQFFNDRIKNAFAFAEVKSA